MAARLFSVAACVVVCGCASMTERIVHQAMQGLAWEGDYKPIEGGSPKALAALYAHLTDVRQIEIGYLPHDDPGLQTPFGPAYGIAYAAGNKLFVRVRQDLSNNGTIEVLAHEAAHLFSPPYLSRPQSDVF